VAFCGGPGFMIPHSQVYKKNKKQASDSVLSLQFPAEVLSLL